MDTKTKLHTILKLLRIIRAYDDFKSITKEDWRDIITVLGPGIAFTSLEQIISALDNQFVLLLAEFEKAHPNEALLLKNEKAHLDTQTKEDLRAPLLGLDTHRHFKSIGEASISSGKTIKPIEPKR